MKFELEEDEVATAISFDGYATVNNLPLELTYTKMQEQVYLNSTAKFTIVSAGRRSGKTAGAAQFLVETLLGSENKNFLWVEVSYGQILTYFDRYFLPLLRQLKPEVWSWNQQRRDLKILSNTLSFRSADRPDLLVGLGYSTIVMNEAGIQLYEYPSIWTQILSPMMLDDSESRAWLIGTPRGLVSKDGKENLFWQMFEKGQSKDSDPNYSSFKYTSYDNPFLDKESIKALEEEVPPLLRAQELFAEFINTSELQIFKPEWWQITDKMPAQHEIYKKYLSVDSAFSEKTSADESAITVWIKTWLGNFLCVDCWHGHLSYPDLVDKIKDLIKTHDPDNVVIENKASGQSLIQTMRNDLPEIGVVKYPPDGMRMPDKVSRATSITSYLESGKVSLLRAHWNKDLINQATIFPVGQYDDICDSISQALLYAKLNDPNKNPFVTRKIVQSRLPGNEDIAETIQTYSLRNPNQHRGF